MYTSNGLAYYRHKDWRGSSPLATTPSRTMYSDVNYAPYGESYPTGGADLNLTSDNQDMLAGLYDTENRELHPNQGRWISPDPAGLGAADPTNPQSWNRYAYVANSPLEFIDPSGLVITFSDDGCVWDEEPQMNGEDGVNATLLMCYYDGTAGIFGSGGTVGGAGNNGTIQPISRAKCAAVFADSIAAHTSGNLPDNTVVQALLGNSISGLYDLWNSPSIGDRLKTLVIGGVNPGLPGPSYTGGLSGVATDLGIKGLATNLGPAAAETASSWFGLLKLGYDGAAFGYEYIFKCN